MVRPGCSRRDIGSGGELHNITIRIGAIPIIKIIPISIPNPIISYFHEVCDDVNQVDGKAIPPLRKLAELVDELVDIDTNEFVHYAFYFEIPFHLYVALTNTDLHCKGESDNFFVKGLISGSLKQWIEFCKRDSDKLLKDVITIVRKYFPQPALVRV